jgi:hypothetical protein
MKIIKSILLYFKDWIRVLFHSFKLFFMSSSATKLENIALRSQLALCKQQVDAGKCPKPQATPAFRQLWVLLSKYFPNWESCLVFFKPETIKKWHKPLLSITGYLSLVKSDALLLLQKPSPS